MKHISKKLICVFLVICLIVSLSSSAYAVGGQRGKATLLAILQAINIYMYQLEGQIRSITPDLLEYLWNPYTYSDWSNYMDRSTIQINGNVVIDGETYTDIWLSKDAADKFRTTALDIKSAYNLANNENATFATGYGSFDGIPVFEVNNTVQSQYYVVNSTGTYSIGGTVVNVYQSQYQPSGVYNFDGTTSYGLTGDVGSRVPARIYARTVQGGLNPVSWQLTLIRPGETTLRSLIPTNTNGIIHDPFDFNYVTEEINLQPIPEGQGLHIYVPQNDFPSSQIPDGSYPVQYPDPTIPGDTGTNVDISDLIGDIIDQLLTDLNIEIDPETGKPILPIPVPTIGEPLPIPEPEPEGTISQTPWQTLADKLNRIISILQSIPQAIATIPSTIQTVGREITEAIDSIGDTVGDIARKIETGVTDLFRDFIDGLTDIFAPFLISIKGSLGIWHYVVEWIGAIGTCFTFFITLFGNVNYAIVVPIYACVAAAICLALYKKFGR